MLQYMAPLLQFVLAVTVLGEQMGPERWVGFGIVWLALVVLTADMIVAAQRRRAAVRAAEARAAAGSRAA
jgi:chloramphenicol-sensitive protein RarD